MTDPDELEIQLIWWHMKIDRFKVKLEMHILKVKN